MIRLAAAFLCVFAGAHAAGPTAELARRISDAGLDPEACYHVRDLNLSRGDIRMYFNDGYLIFGKPVDGVRLSAVFSAETEAGDAEVIVMPPTRSERLSLASFAKSPNLNEHFRSAVFVFSDDTFTELEAAIRKRDDPRRSPERGALMAQEWHNTVRNFTQSFQVRLVRDMLSENRASYGFFYSAVTSPRLGNFDLMFDPRVAQQIVVGQVAFRDEQAFFDTWTRFPARAFRQGRRTVPAPDVLIQSYRIDATLEPSLNLRAVTRAVVNAGSDGKRALSLDISPQMRVTEAEIDGIPAEVFQPESMRSTLIRGVANETFLVIPEKPLQPGHEYEVVFKHEGGVITDAGNSVYFVGARGAWYPNRFSQFSKFDMTFRYPKNLDLVATGRAQETSTEGEWRVARHRTDVPVRMAGFNLGQFEHASVNRSGYTIDVYANRQVEAALQPKRERIVVLPSRPGVGGQPRWTVDIQPVPVDTIRPASRLEQLAIEIAGALDFMADHLGPPILKHLTVSPIPAGFGQGFPGLIYLSTLAYLDPKSRPQSLRTEQQQLFFSEILQAHETAHQWWGNVLTSATYEDDWIMEALANYSALMYLEKRKGEKAVESVLDAYRSHLLAKNDAGNTVESAGPIIWGPRLVTSHTPQAWRIITYEKGSWIVHMLRRRMGDARFLEMLGQLRRRYQQKSIDTEEFRKHAAEFLPPKSPDPQLEGFFEQFVYSTGIPTVKLNYTVKGAAPQIRVSGTVTQSDVDADFSAYVPIEIQFGKGKPITQWVRASGDATPFSVAVRQQPTRVVLDPGGSLLKK